MKEFYKQIKVSSDNNFTYIFGSREIVILDPAFEKDKIETALSEYDGKLKYIINTHTHYDHNNLNAYFQEKYSVPVIVHKNESKNVSGSKIEVNGGEIFELGNETFKIIHTPGHTPGSITVVYRNYLFTGDTLFADEDCGRIFYDGGIKDMFESLKIFKDMDGKNIVLSGHKYGKYENTLLEYEKINNPALLCGSLEALRQFKKV